MVKKELETPILLIIFNRPALTKRVLDRIREIKPKNLFVAADGPRDNNSEDIKKCQETRKLFEKIDWECDLKTNFQQKNLGCKVAPATAIDWFFSQVDRGIILEDDVLPDSSFFHYCQDLLETYKDDERIGMISGNNFQFGKRRAEDSYYFSNYTQTWGWATWKRAWQKFDLNIQLWPEMKKGKWLEDIFESKKSAFYWKLIFDAVYTKKINSAWDYQWTFASFINNFLTIIPNVNLVQNIGVGVEGATHTTVKNKFSEVKSEKMEFPLKHPVFVIKDRQADGRIQKNNYVLWKEIGSRVIKRINLKP